MPREPRRYFPDDDFEDANSEDSEPSHADESIKALQQKKSRKPKKGTDEWSQRSRQFTHKIELRPVTEMAVGMQYFEELRSGENFFVDEAGDGRIIFRDDIIYRLPWLEDILGARMPSVENQGTRNVLLQLICNDVGSRLGRGKMYTVGQFLPLTPLLIERAGDVCFTNQLWSSDEIATLQKLTPVDRTVLFSIENAPECQLMSIRIISATLSNTSNQVRPYSQVLSAAVLLILDDTPHIMWESEWRAHLHNDGKHDERDREEFRFTKKNLSWLEEKKVQGAEGLVKHLCTMVSQAKQKQYFCSREDIAAATRYRPTEEYSKSRNVGTYSCEVPGCGQKIKGHKAFLAHQGLHESGPILSDEGLINLARHKSPTERYTGNPTGAVLGAPYAFQQNGLLRSKYHYIIDLVDPDTGEYYFSDTQRKALLPLHKRDQPRPDRTSTADKGSSRVEEQMGVTADDNAPEGMSPGLGTVLD